MIDPRYQRWIDENAPKDARTARGRCGVETRAMCAAFPELRAAGGYYYGAMEHPSQHWWCVAPDGTIVDPTAIQFLDRGAGCYDEIPPEDHPRGKCMDCGDMTFDRESGGAPNAHVPTFCGAACCRDFCLGTFGEFTHPDGRIEYSPRDEDV